MTAAPTPARTAAPSARVRTVALLVLAVCALAACLAATGCSSAPSAADDAKQEAPAPDADTGDTDADAQDADPDEAAPSTTGALHVEGSRLVGEDGRPAQLRGVSTHGLAWFPQYVNEELFKELRSDWGANVVRLAMYTAESGGYCTDGDRAKLQKLVEQGVDYAAAADLYAIVDWHILSDADPNQHVDEAVAYFDAMSRKFADRPNVIYEICNEPNGDTSWADIKRYADKVIPAIRANAPEAVVLVGTPTWSQRVDEAAADPLDFDNVMYTLHFYAATHQQDLRDRLSAAVAAGLPVFVSEFGICDASGSGTIDYASADAWVDLMDSLDVSYVCWNLSNKDESSSLFKAGCDKTSGFGRDDLSEEGRWLWGVLHGEEVEPDETGGAPAEAGAGMTAAAGSDDEASGTAGDLAFEVEAVNAWEADGARFSQYEVEVTNRGAQATGGWELTVPVAASGTPTVTDSWNARCTAAAGGVDLSNMDYNGRIAPGATVEDIGFIVRG